MPDFFGRILGRAAFEGVEFPCAEADTDGAADGVKHKAYLRPGADIEPTGREPYSGTMTIPLFNSIEADLFPGRYFDLLSKFEASRIGTLSHPTKGVFSALIESWRERLSPDARNGVLLEVHWSEHNAESGILLADPQDAPTTATNRASTADAAMALADPTSSYTPTSPVIADQLVVLDASVTNYAQIATSISIMLAVVNRNLALPVFATVSGYEAVTALEELRAQIYLLQSRFLPDTRRTRYYRTPTTMSDTQVARTVYGSIANVGLIRTANPLADPSFIAAGTVLTILPAPE